jgi:predicted PurR-regulated permease PerM
MPLAIGGILAMLFLPFCKWMEKKKVPKGLAVLICLLILVLIIAGIVVLLGWQINELTNDFSALTQKATDMGTRIQEFIFNNFGISAEKQSQLLKKEQPSIMGIIQKVAGSLSYILVNFILLLVYIFLFLYYRNHIKQFIIKLNPASQRKEIEQMLYSITHVTQKYIIGLLKMIVCLWIMYGLSFTLIGVKNALFFAFICGLLEIVPFFGNIIGTTLTVLATAVQGGSFPLLLGIICTYLIVQLIQEWLLDPIILGPQVKINPFSTIIALILGRLIWGVPGLFIAIPLMAMFKIICDHIESLKPYGFLIGETETKKGEPDFVKKIKNRLTKKKL